MVDRPVELSRAIMLHCSLSALAVYVVDGEPPTPTLYIDTETPPKYKTHHRASYQTIPPPPNPGMHSIMPEPHHGIERQHQRTQPLRRMALGVLIPRRFQHPLQ